MARTRKRKLTSQLLSPEPEPEPETLPPLLLTPLPQPGPITPTTQIVQRVWSKFDVIVIIKGMVNYIAEMSVDPMTNLDDFVEFINKNSSSSSYNGYDCSKFTWNLGKNGVDDENNCSLHLETRIFDDLGKKNDGGCGFGDKVLNLGKNDCRVSCLSDLQSVMKKDSFVDDVRVLNLGMNDGGGVKKKLNVDTVSNSGKNVGGIVVGGGRVLNLGINDGGSVVGNLSNSGKNDGVSCLGSVNNGKKIGVCEEKVNCIENVGGNRCMSSRKNVEESKLGADYGRVNCTETRKDMKKGRGEGIGLEETQHYWWMGKNRPESKEVVDGNKQKGGCASLSGFGCWDKNEVTLIEAVGQMISRRLSLRDELQTDLLWCPPRIGVLKWNTDASVRKYGNKAAIGGVLRDWNGSFRCVFSCPLDCCESNEAEVKAIYKALEIASCKDWLLNLHMVIESDSLNAVRWCNENSGGPLNLSYMLTFIRECIRWWPGLKITYAGRESNSVADRLSKQGHEMSPDFVAWM